MVQTQSSTVHFSRNPYFDGLRGLCALYVIFFHINVASGVFENLHPGFKSFVITGALSVQVFFCLSGYLVFASLLRLKESGRPLYRAFYLNRFLRIIPLWWALLFYRYYYWSNFNAKILFANMFFFFGDLGDGSPFLPVIPSWSLLSEELFYIFLPLFFIYLTYKRSIIISLLFLGLTPLITQYLFAIKPAEWSQSFVWRNPLLQFQYFFTGIALYNLVSLRQLDKKLGLIVKRITPFLFDLVTLGIFFNALSYWGVVIPEPIRVLALVINVLSEKSLFCKFVGHRWLGQLGIWCYGIYILQEESGFIIYRLQKESFSSPYLFLLTRWVMSLCIVVPLAGLSYKFFESPIIRWGKARFS